MPEMCVVVNEEDERLSNADESTREQVHAKISTRLLELL